MGSFVYNYWCLIIKKWCVHTQAAVLKAPCAVKHVYNDLLLQLWMCVEGIWDVDTMSHKAQMGLRSCSYR